MYPITFSTLLSPLLPLIQLFGPMFEGAGTDEPETPPASPEHTGTEIDEQPAPSPEPEGEPEPEETPEVEDDAEEVVRRNAAQKISKQGQDLRATDLAVISLLADAPSKASKYIAQLKDENPALASRIARMVEGGGDDLEERLKNADPMVRETLQALVRDQQALSQRTEADRKAQETRIFKNWREDKAPFLSPKTAEGQTPQGKRLRNEFRTALDTLFPEDAPLTEDMLEDALVIAKRRSGWQSNTVKQAVDKQAAEQAAKARAASAPKGGVRPNPDGAPAVNPRIAGMFGRKSPEQLARIAEEKKKAGFQ